MYYVSNEIKKLDEHKCGKWMYFFADAEYAAIMCKQAVENGIVYESKHTDGPSGVCCFYLNYDDNEAHKKVITFFLKNNLIRKTKKGRYYNISYKLDDQTKAGEYGKDFKAEIKLDEFIDLDTGEFLEDCN